MTTQGPDGTVGVPLNSEELMGAIPQQGLPTAEELKKRI